MKIGIVGGSYQERSLPFDAQRSVNLFPVVDETQGGKEVASMYGTPGLEVFSVAGDGSVRACFSASNGRAFAVSGSALYEIDSAGTATSRGTLSTSGSVVTMEENGSQLALCDGSSVYIFTYATNILTVVTDVDLPSAGTITFLDGYFIVNKNSSGAFYISSLYDGTAWNALDFASAESSPDSLVRVFQGQGQLWLFGEKTTEIWSNIGGTGFPFERINGAKIEVGCAAAHSVVSMDNSVFWLGKDDRGTGIVYRANGFNPERISTHAIEYKLQNTANLNNLRAYTYQEDGHIFYVLTGGSLDTTFVWDNTTNLWHERAYMNTFGIYEIQLPTCHMFAFGKHLVGDRASGNIYRSALDIYSDNGNPIKRMRVCNHIGEEGKIFRVNSIRVDFERGVGLTTGQGSNPIANIRLSKDGARSWSNEYSASIGAKGKRKPSCTWNRLGYYEELTIELTITDPVKVAITGAYLE